MKKFLFFFLSFVLSFLQEVFAQPSNDNPCNAITLTPNSSCSYSTYTNTSATATSGIPAPGCANYAGGDVWFTVTVPASGAIEINSNTGGMTDGAMAIYSATSCSGSFTLIECDDDDSPNGLMPYINAGGLPVGSTIYIRFWEYGNDNNSTFQICVVAQTPPTNDNPCGAISLPVNPSCSYSTYTTVNASGTTGPPAPGCANYQGGDVWFSVTVPSSGTIEINTNTGGITDGGMAIYSASSCSGSMTLIECDDDDSPNGAMAMITKTGLTPGSTIYIRFWEYANDNPGTFQICATQGSTPPCTGGGNTTCSTADPFCTGTTYTYCNTTGVSSAGSYDCLFTTPNPAYYYLQIATSGNIVMNISQTSNSGSGIDVDFILWGPFSNTSAACTAINANPNNNVVDCSYDPAPTETATIPSAVVNQWYMIMITNFANEAGSVTFLQSSGSGATNCNIVTPCPITAGSNSPLCAGQTLNLTATTISGATYSWSGPGGYTSSNQNPTRTNVTTAMAGTYTVTVTAPGPCTSTSSVTVTINALPSVSVSPSATTVCSGYATTLTASGANTYTWSPSTGLSATTGSSVTATPTSTTTYTVTGTNTTTGCTNTATSTITVNPPLSISVTPSAPSICSGNSVSLTASGASTYSWSPSGGLSATTGATVTASPTSTTTYTVTGSATNCNNASTTVTVTVNSTASGFTYNGNQCLSGNSYNFTNTGAMGSATYSWSFPSGTPSTSTAQNPSGITWSSPGTYTVSQTVTANGCSSTSTQNITVYGQPTVSITPINPSCNTGCTGQVTASGSGGTAGYTYSWSNSLGTGATKTGLCAGTYTVTVSDANSCTGTNSVTLTAPPALSGNTSSTNVNCNGVCSGTVSVSGSGGTPIYTYSWNGGLGMGSPISNVCAGNYSVTITDANNCTAVQSAAVTEPSSLNASASATPASCNSSCTGTLSASATGGITNYTFNWSGGLGMGSPISNVCAGNYTVTITDANGCTSVANITVNQPAALTPTATGTNVSCNGGNNGSASASVSGGTPSYTYSWSSGSASSSATGLSAGNYTVTVSDGNLCTATTSVTITEPSALTASTSATAASCNGSSNGNATVTPNGGTSPYFYQWDGTAGFQTTQTATGLTAGTYSVTVTGVGGCTATASATVNQPSAISATTASTNSTCGSATGTATVTGTGGTSPYTYSWSTSPSQTSATATGLLAGSYTVTITDANNCTNTATASVSSAGAPTANISASENVFCFGGNNGNATVTASGGATPYTYFWSPSGGTAAIANGLTAGTFCVNVTDDNNCVVSVCTTITEPTQLSAIPTSVSNTTCNGVCNGSATISVSGGVSPYTYSWDGGGISATKTGLCAGNFNVTVTDNNGCGIVVAVSIAEPTSITASATASATSCNGVCDGDGNLTSSGGTSPYTFLWDNGETVEDATSLCSGTNTITITDANSCTGTTSVNVNEPSALILTPSSTNSACGQSNGTATVAVSGGTSSYSYLWNTGDATSSVFGLPASVYSVTVTDANGCVATNTVIVNNSSGGTASSTVNSNATGAGLCNGSATGTMTGGTSPYTYLWSNGQTATTATGLCAGSNCVTITDANGCSDIACVTITEPSAVSATAVPTGIQCFGNCNGSISLTVSGGVSPFTYFWSNGATAQNISNLCSGNYSVTITDANSITATTSATINSPSAISATANPNNIVCNGACTGTISLTAIGGTEPYSFLWSNGQTTLNANSLCAGNYSVTITDNSGCTGTTSAAITEPAAINLTFSSVNANCGANDGTATVSVSGATSPYTYLWNAGSTTNQQTGIAAGTYSVTVTDANNCTVDGNVVVNNNTAGTPSAVVDNHISCNGGTNGQATASITGGTPPYTYKWNSSPMQTTPTATGLSAGTYSVTITDASCPVVVSVTITEPSALTVTATATSAGCFGNCNGTTTANASGGTSPYSYQWNDGNFQTTATATGLCAGNFSATISDANTCTTTNSATVAQEQEIVLSTSSVQSTCNQADGSATISIVSGTSPFSYLWNDSLLQTTATADTLKAGCYSVTITDGNSCTKVENVCVTDAGSPSVSVLTKTDVSCFGGNDGFSQISVSGGNPPYSYSWNTSPAQTTASAFNLSAGTYVGSMADATGCNASISVTINEPTVLNAIVTALDASCFNSCNGSANGVISGGTSPYSYLWNDANSQTTASATGLCAGTFTVQISDSNSCDTSISVTISEPIAITSSATPTSAFCGTASGSACATASGGTSPYSYLWNDASSQNTSCADSIIPGNYTVTITDSNNCTSTANTSVGNVPSGNASISNAVNVSCNGNCDGQASVSMGGSGTSPFTYLWAASANNQTNDTAFALCAGNHEVTVTDANGCTATSTAIISAPAPLAISSQIIVNAICFGQCNGNATVDATGGTFPYSYLWSDLLSQTGKTATGLCSGNYIVTITDVNGCTVSQLVSITQPQQISYVVNSINANCNQSNAFGCIDSVSGGTSPYSYLWQNGNINSCSVSLAAGTYIITITDANNCTNSASVVIQNINGPTATISSQTNINCNGNCNGSATASANGGASPYSFQWSANANNQFTPTASNLCGGMYTVTITDTAGCAVSVSTTITEPAAISYNPQFTNPTCFNGNNGTASVTVAGGTTPYSYLWNTGVQTQNLASIQAGNYSLTVTDANNCTEILSYTLTNPLQITTSMNTLAAICNDSCDGKATVTASSGATPYSYSWNDANSQTSQQANGLCAGNYTVQITDANNCTTTSSAIISEPTTISASINNSGNVSCNGACNGYAQVSVSGGTPAYTYSWSNSSVSQVNSNLCAGNYTVTVTDANGCTKTAIANIIQPQAFSSSIIGTNVSCGGVCNGQAAVNPIGGATPYSYLWSANANFQQSPTANALCGGNYSVTITDSAGCQIYKSIFIFEPTPLSLVSNKSDAHCEQNDGSICINAMGGSIPYSYQWNDPNTQTSSCATGLYAGCYIMNITDGAGCSVDTLICLNDIAGPTIAVDDTAHVTCSGANNGMINFNVTGGTPDYSILWYNSSGDTVGLSQYANSTGSGFTLSGGTYTLVVTDSANCISALPQTILEPEQISSAVINSVNVSCNGVCSGSATIGVTDGTPPYSYVWNTGQTVATATGLCAGVFQVTISDINNCTKTQVGQITEPLLPLTATGTTINISCNGNCDGAILINANGGTGLYSYDWNPNTAGNFASAYGLCAGAFSTTVTDANFCTTIQITTLTEPQPLNYTPIITSETCSNCNGSATVSGTGGTSPYFYSWSPSGGNAATATNLCSGNNYVTVSDAMGCALNDTIIIPDEPAPQITDTVVVEPSCTGMNNGSATVNFSDGTPPFTYNWSNNSQNQTATNLSAGTYSVTVMDVNLCIVQTPVIVSQPTPVNAISDGSGTICYGQSTQIFGSGEGGTSPYTILWTGSSSDLTGFGPHIVNPLVDESYFFTITDDNGCTANGSISIDVSPPLNVNIVQGSTIMDTVRICDGDSATVCSSPSGGGSAYIYQWSGGSADSCFTVTAQSANPLSVILSDGCSLADTAQVILKINTLPLIDFNTLNTPGCPPLTVNFLQSINPSGSNVNYEWLYGDGSTNGTGSNPMHIYTDSGQYSVSLIVSTIPENCVDTLTKQNFIQVYPTPLAAFEANPTITTLLNPDIVLNATNTSGADSVLIWDMGDGSDSSGISFSHSYNDTGTFTVILTAINTYGCLSTDTEIVIIKDEFIIFAPNAFSPNGDNINDIFFPKGVGINPEKFKLWIFDRWGDIIFESNNVNSPWDGTAHGGSKPVQIGVYIWLIETEDNQGTQHRLIGTVAVVK